MNWASVRTSVTSNEENRFRKQEKIAKNGEKNTEPSWKPIHPAMT